MKLIVPVKKGDQQGEVTFDDKNNKVTVDFPDPDVNKAIIDFLHTEKEFQIPQSNKVDDYEVVKALPASALGYFELGMCTLYARTGVWVQWEGERRQK